MRKWRLSSSLENENPLAARRDNVELQCVLDLVRGHWNWGTGLWGCSRKYVRMECHLCADFLQAHRMNGLFVGAIAHWGVAITLNQALSFSQLTINGKYLYDMVVT